MRSVSARFGPLDWQTSLGQYLGVKRWRIFHCLFAAVIGVQCGAKRGVDACNTRITLCGASSTCNAQHL